jgi:hypothetical protein
MVLLRGSGTIWGLQHRHVPLSLNRDAIAKQLGIGAPQSIERGGAYRGAGCKGMGHRLVGHMGPTRPASAFCGTGDYPGAGRANIRAHPVWDDVVVGHGRRNAD